MSVANRQNTLATWVSQGGKLWALGGGFGNARTPPWNNLNNDLGVRTYRFDGTRPDLTPGRFMYDWCHWRRSSGSSARASYGSRARPAGPDGGFPRPVTTGGRNVHQPEVNYTSLPTRLMPRDPATRPDLPTAWPGDFYVGNQAYSANGIHIEYLSLENRILEDFR